MTADDKRENHDLHAKIAHHRYPREGTYEWHLRCLLTDIDTFLTFLEMTHVEVLDEYIVWCQRWADIEDSEAEE